MKTFNANGKTYKTDSETLALLDSFRTNGNSEMVAATFELGLAFGRIVEVK